MMLMLMLALLMPILAHFETGQRHTMHVAQHFGLADGRVDHTPA